MRHLLLYIVALLVVTVGASCGNKSPEDEAAKVAKQYYDLLLEGDFDAYVGGMYLPDSISDGYREQLVANAKMYMGQMETEHQGLKDVRIVNAKADTALHVALVSMMFTFGDSTREEVVIPMVEHQGNWKLR